MGAVDLAHMAALTLGERLVVAYVFHVLQSNAAGAYSDLHMVRFHWDLTQESYLTSWCKLTVLFESARVYGGSVLGARTCEAITTTSLSLPKANTAWTKMCCYCD